MSSLDRLSSYNRLYDKLNECEVFFEEMLVHHEKGDLTRCRYKASAFLTAARTILQVLLAKARYLQRQQGQGALMRLYDETWMKRDILRFCREKRNSNVHEAHLGETPNAVVLHETETASGTKIRAVHYELEFSEWTGEDKRVVTVCRLCLEALKEVLAEAVDRKFVVEPGSIGFKYR